MTDTGSISSHKQNNSDKNSKKNYKLSDDFDNLFDVKTKRKRENSITKISKTSKKTSRAKDSHADHIDEDKLNNLRKSDVTEEIHASSKEKKKLMGIGASIPEDIEYLRVHHLSEGFIVLASVQNISQKRAQLMLPGAIRAKLDLDNLSDTLFSKLNSSNLREDDKIPSISDFLKIGQIIKVAVISTENTVTVSMKESILNKEIEEPIIGNVISGSVKSKEENGYIINLGNDDLRGFLPFHNVFDAVEFIEGSPLVLRVEYYDRNMKFVKLSYEEKLKINSPPVRESKDELITIGSLQPGMILDTKVTAILPHGLWITFLTYFNGAIDLLNISPNSRRGGKKDESNVNYVSDTDLSKFFHRGDNLKARILYIHPITKNIFLTILPEILKLEENPMDKYKVGDIVSGTLKFYIPNRGGILITQDNYKILVPKPRFPDENINDNGCIMNTRIMAISDIERVFIATAKSAELNEKYFLLSDLTPGDIVNGIIKATVKGGFLVELSPYIVAFLPHKHLSDLDLSSIDSSFKIGSNIKCRVLKVDLIERKVHLTCKKSLLRSNLPPFYDWNQIKPGMISIGTIVNVLKNGCVIKFYGDVKGYVPLNSCDLVGSSIHELYKKNQTIKCRVLKVSPEDHKLILSFHIVESSSLDFMQSYLTPEHVGKVIEAEIQNIKDDIILLQWTPAKDIKIPVIMYTSHLSDHLGLVENIRSTLEKGEVMKNIIIYDIHKHTVLVSKKESVVNTHYIKDINQILVGSIHPGHIQKILDKGILVKIFDWIGFVSIPNSGVRADMLSKYFRVNQSVNVHVLDVDSEKKRLFLSLTHVQNQDYLWLKSYFKSLDEITEKTTGNTDWNKYKPGKLIEAIVEKFENYGVVLSVKNENLELLATKALAPGTYDIGQKVKALILDVDKEKLILDVTLNQETIHNFTKTRKSGNAENSSLIKKLEKSSSSSKKMVSVIVQLVKSNYIVVSYENLIAYWPTGDFNNVLRRNPFEIYQIGQNLHGHLHLDSENSDRIIIKPDIIVESTNNSSIILRKELSQKCDLKIDSQRDLKVGQRVSATVKKINPQDVLVKLTNNVSAILPLGEIVDTRSEYLDKDGYPIKVDLNERIPVEILNKLTDDSIIANNPSDTLSIGQNLPDCVIQYKGTSDNPGKFFVSIRPSALNNWKPPTLPEVGSIMQLWVLKYTPLGLIVAVNGMKNFGKVFITDTSGDLDVLLNLENNFKIGQGLIGVLMCYNEQTPLFSLKAFTHPDLPYSVPQLKEGQIVLGRIEKVQIDQYVLVSVLNNCLVTVHQMNLFDKWISHPTSSFVSRIGEIVKVKITCIIQDPFRVQGSLRESDVEPELAKDSSPDDPNSNITPTIKSLSELRVGKIYFAFVRRVMKDKHCIIVSNGPGIRILVPYSQLDEKSHPERKYFPGDLVKVFIKLVDARSSKCIGCMKQHLLNCELMKINDLKIGKIVECFVVGHSNNGVFLKIKNTYLKGFCLLEELSDDLQEEKLTIEILKVEYRIGSLLKGVICKVDCKKNTFNVTLKRSELEKAAREPVNKISVEDDPKSDNNNNNKLNEEVNEYSYDDSDEDSLESVDGNHSKVMRKKKRSINLIEKDDQSELVECEDVNDETEIRNKKKKKGNDIKDENCIFSHDNKKGNDDDDDDDDDEDSSDSNNSKNSSSSSSSNNKNDAGNSDSSDNDISASDSNSTNSFGNEDGDKCMEIDSDDENIDNSDSSSEKNLISANFELNDLEFKIDKKPISIENWSESEDEDDSDVTNVNNNDISEISERSNNSKSSGKISRISKRTKKDLKHEIQIESRENILMDDSRPLETLADHEMAILKDHNSSINWIQFMSYYLKNNQLEKAREIADTALKRIETNRKQDILNIWIALMNLENQYGTPKTFEDLISRAVKIFKAKSIYIEAINSCIRFKRISEAEKFHQIILKKWKHCASSWINLAMYNYKKGNEKYARDLLNKALASLAPRKHIKLLTKYAMMEFKYGTPERARTILENLVFANPKRTDIWNIWLDLETSKKDPILIRALYERIISLNFKSSKMKPFFKRYIKYEIAHGTPERVEMVKKKAQQYIEQFF